MAAGYPWITLTTDYGLSDGFRATLHGVIARQAPGVHVIDITHDIHPGDVSRGASVLAQAAPHMPESVHVAIIDPGVGTARRAVAIRTPGGLLVGPDNGVLMVAADALGGAEAAVELTNTDWHLVGVSATFHGRDVFAPVAARLAAGSPFAEAGREINLDSLVRLPAPSVRIGDGFVEAEVLTVDRFGNVQLAAPAGPGLDALGPGQVLVGGLNAACGTTFGEVAPGSMLVFGDSAGYLAIAINGGLAVVALGVEPGEMVRLDRV
ncbi:MAG TPA: SAM-dependent chlorinase/fluorinase [Micromonosporaceae bacterium]